MIGNWFQKAAMWFGSKAFSLSDQEAVAGLLRVLGGGHTDSGVIVNQDSAIRASAVWGCIRVLAETIGALPHAIYRREPNGDLTRADDHEIAAILQGSPNSAMTPQELIEALMVNLALAGNAYSIIERAPSGRIVSVTPYPAQFWSPELTPDGLIVYKFNDRGQEEILPPEKVWHVKGFGPTGLIGYSPIACARQAIGVSLATEEFGARFFKNGASTMGIVKSKEWLKDKQREEASKKLETMWQGLANSHKIQLLEGGMEFQSVVMPLEDAQFLQTRKFQVEEICRIYRVPPHMVAELTRSTNNNIEQQGQEFLHALLPYLTRFEQTMSKRLLSPADRGRYVWKFNFEGILRADSAARSQLYATMLQNGVMSRNEVRGKENLPRSPDPAMDDYTVQSNMTMVQFLEAMSRGQNGQA